MNTRRSLTAQHGRGISVGRRLTARFRALVSDAEQPHLFRFRAVVRLNRSAEGGPTTELPAMTDQLVIRGHRSDRPQARLFAALVSTDDGEPLRPGDRHHVVTLTTADGEALDCLTCGAVFELWQGHDLGQGTVTRRVFT